MRGRSGNEVYWFVCPNIYLYILRLYILHGYDKFRGLFHAIVHAIFA